MQIAFHQEGLSRSLAREKTVLSSIVGKVAARQAFDASDADDDRATATAGAAVVRLDPARGFDAGVSPAIAFALTRASAGAVRLDPARGHEDGDWWQRVPSAKIEDVVAEHGAMLDETGDEPVELLPKPPQQPVDNLPDAQTPEPPSVPPVVRLGPELDAEGRRLRHWLSRSRLLKRLRLLRVRDESAKGILGLLLRRSALGAQGSGPLDRGEPLSAGARPADLQAVVTDTGAPDRSPEPPFSAHAAQEPTEPTACERDETPSIAERVSAVPARLKDSLGLGEGVPVFLFAGEMSYAAGIDILTEALIVICQCQQDARFVLVGDGPLKSTMEAQVARAGFAHHCRFTGDLAPAEFDQFLTACDVVVIPARERQDSGLPERALSLGKPVLTTHAAHIRGIVHGQNGLLAYDCANSLVWGIRELLTKTLQPYPQPRPVERQAA
ncbi:MAG: glycosyltransferase family 4 protein [Defluviicoccus sp.]